MSSTNPIILVDGGASENDDNTIYSNSDDDTVDLRSIVQNCIVKMKMKDVYDEWTAKRNNTKWIYGITEYLEDRCEVTGKNAWHIMWHVGPYNTDGFDSYEPLLPVHEDELILVRHPEDEIENLDIPYLQSYVSQEQNGKWVWKIFHFQCQYCFSHLCDRCVHREELQESIEAVMMYDSDLLSNTKRRKLYAEHIRQKYGQLGANNRRRPAECVVKLVRDFFPNTTGTPYVGYHPN